MMAYYEDESGKKITFNLQDREALDLLGDALLKAPIDVEYLHFIDGDYVGTLNLNTMEVL